MSNTKATIGGALRDSSENWLTDFYMITGIFNVFQIGIRAIFNLFFNNLFTLNYLNQLNRSNKKL